MSPRKTPLRPIPPSDRHSEVRPRSAHELPVILDLHFAHPNLLIAVRKALVSALAQAKGEADNDGQAFLFPELSYEDITIPKQYADEVIRMARLELAERCVQLEKTPDAIRVVAAPEEDDDPYRESGY